MSDMDEVVSAELADDETTEQLETGAAAVVPTAETPTNLGKLPDPGLKGQPYEYNACTIGVTFTLLADDGTGNRSVLVTVRSHEDMPAAMELFRLSDLIGEDGQSFGKAPLVIAEMLEAMKEALIKRIATQKQAQRKTITVENGKPAQAAVPATPASKPNGQIGLF